MRRSDAYLPTTRDDGGVDRDDVRLAHRAGLIRKFGSGLYALTPAGYRVREKLVDRIDAAMRAIGGQRVSLPQLNYRDIWAASGRWESFEGEMFTLENRDGSQLCLAPSHEEAVVALVDGHVRSYADLPLLLYQVGTKHRDDHARNGLLRTKEFTMKDAYSLHATADSRRETYREVRSAYERIFDGLDLAVAICDADNSVMGGTRSEEFVAPVDDGSCDLVHCTGDHCRFGITDEHVDFETLAGGDTCPDCERDVLAASDGIEVGHVFQLGTTYADAMGLTVDTADGDRRPVEMASYGIGVTRLLQTLLAQHADDDGCRWSAPDTSDGVETNAASRTRTVAPYDVSIVPLSYDGEIRAGAEQIHDALDDAGVDVLLYDDAHRTIGERFAESDLLGVPTKVVLGNHYTETGEVELETRDGATRYRDLDDALAELTASTAR